MIGLAAERMQVVRTVNFTRDVLYSKALSADASSADRGSQAGRREIPLPGLPDLQSQMVAPLAFKNRLLGVICFQSTTPGRFLSDDERAIRILAGHLATVMTLHRGSEISEERLQLDQPHQETHLACSSTVVHYSSDDSLFLNDEYLIKGIAGRILWKLLQIHNQTGRTDFSNKEIRLDANLKLPDIKDNLEARLILLRRRLQDRHGTLELVQLGRGRFRIEVGRKLTLVERE